MVATNQVHKGLTENHNPLRKITLQDGQDIHHLPPATGHHQVSGARKVAHKLKPNKTYLAGIEA